MSVLTYNHSEQISRLMTASADALAADEMRSDWWGMYSAAAELLKKHDAGEIALQNMPLTLAWIESTLGEKL